MLDNDDLMYTHPHVQQSSGWQISACFEVYCCSVLSFCQVLKVRVGC